METTSITVNFTPPAFTINPVTSPATKTSQKINGTIEAGATVSVITDIAVSDGFATVSRTTWNYTIPGLVVFPNKLSSEAHPFNLAAYGLPTCCLILKAL